MHPTLSFTAIVLAALLFAGGLPARADEGHDHGDASPVAGGPALPRFSAVSESFELVGVLSGREITLYLDRFADNTPVTGATIELEIAGARYEARARDDTYEVVLSEAPTPGELPITATVIAGSDTDLLAGELDLHEAAHADEPADTHAGRAAVGWAAGGLAALVVLAVGTRRLWTSRRVRAGGAA